MAASFKDRHPSTAHMMQMLEPNPNLKAGKPSEVAEKFWQAAVDMVNTLQDGPELTAGLRHLMEAKDCFVRCAVHGQTVDYRDR